MSKEHMSIFDKEDAETIRKFVLEEDISGWFKNNEGGFYLQKFQKQFAEYCNSKYALACSSGSISIYLALKALDLGRECCIAVPTYTHVGSVAPIILAGAKPVFTDCDKYGNISVKSLTDTGVEFDAIIAVHQLGMPVDIDLIKERYPDTPIIEDASHAMGSRYKGKHVGNLGEIGCFSVGGGRTKTIGLGEGGVIVTNNANIAEKIKNLRNHGDRNYDKPYFCFNHRVSELNALLGYLQMRKVDLLVGWQERNAEYLIANLPDYLEVPEVPSYAHHCRYIIGCHFNSEVFHGSRSAFLDRMKDFQIGPRRYVGSGYTKLVSDVKYYQRWRKQQYQFSEKIRDESVWIDFHRPWVTRSEIDLLLKRLKEFE